MATIFMDKYRIIDALFDAALAGDADAIAKLRVQANRQDKDGETILHLEIRKRNIERVIFILREFGSGYLLVKTEICLGWTALHFAAYRGNAQVVEVLLDAARQHLSKTSFQAFLRQSSNRYKETALHVAVEKGNVDIAKLLVEADPIDRHGQNLDGKSPMYIAVESGFDDIVDIISKTCTAPSLDGPDGRFALRITNHDQVKSSGGTLYKIMDRDALYAAAVAGDADAIAKLEKEADILNKDDETILHVESRSGNTERVRFILKQFANKNLLTKLNIYKHTALHSAIYSRHTEKVEMVEVLIEAARRDFLRQGDKDIGFLSFQDFLRQGDKDMDTALHAAVREGNIAIVKLLVEADPTDRHIQNKKGETPMYIAVENGHNDIVEIISTTCTAPSLDGPDGSTAMPIKNHDQVTGPGVARYKIMDRDALYATAIAGDEDAIAKLELEADKLNKDDETILHVESRNGNTENVRFILREFANNNLLLKCNKDKDTALHLAAYHGHTEVVEVLIDAAKHLPPSSANDNTHENPITSFQAFLGLVDKDRNTALHMAVMQGNLATAKLLVEANPSHEYWSNHQHKTPIYIAAERGYAEIAKMICTSDNFFLNGPGGSNALHAAIKNLDEGKKEVRDVFKTIVNVLKCRLISKNKNSSDYVIHRYFQRVFSGIDDYEQTILELAVERNYQEVVELILDLQNPAYRDDWIGDDFINLMPLIYKARDKEYKNIAELLNKRYEVGAQLSTHLKNQASLISAIRRRKKETVFSLLDDHAEPLVSFVDKLGWTALHHAAYHGFDPIITTIVEAQKKIGHQFVYRDMLPTPFHIAAEKGHTSTVILLMQLWPSWSSAYMAVDRNGQNILHLAALQSNKKMIQGILEHIPEENKEEFVNKQDHNNGNTPLHLLITSGCFVPELIRYQGLDMRLENKDKWTPPDMLYINDQITDGQVQIKFALDHIQINQKRDIVISSLLSEKRQRKNVIFEDRAEPMIHAKLALIMKEDTHAIANCFLDAIAGDAISKAALEKKADTPNQAGETILHVESKEGNIENVRFILSVFAKKSLLSKLDNLKQTALHLAAHHGHTQVVKVLIDAARHWPSSSSSSSSSSANDFIRQATVPMGNTALHLAVLDGNVAIVRLIVDADPTDRHVQNNEGKTPIYIAAEKGYEEIIKEICMTCTALSLDGPALPPAGRTTALHAFLQNMGQDGASDVIRMMIAAAKRSSADDASHVNFEALFTTIDVSGSTVLQLAVEKNFVDAVRLILQEDPAYQPGREIKRNDLMLLIFEAIDNECNDIVELLSQGYQVGIDSPDHKDVLALILAIQKHDKDCVLRLLQNAPGLVTFTDDHGWTPLHYATYHEFDSILDAIIKAQRDEGLPFEYPNTVSTPFHVSVKYGYTSTMLRLMELWPTSSSDYSPYTVVNEDGRNILHLAAADSRKEMVQGILKYCPKMYKDQILKQKDHINGDTPLHLLFANGCFIPGLLKYEGLDAMAKNNKEFTPRDMLYVKDDIVADQVRIKFALDDVQTNQSSWKLWGEKTKKNIWKTYKVTPSKRKEKDGKFDERKKNLEKEKQENMKKDLEKYKSRTNTQIIVTALITTVAFTVGFTMPGGLYQSGDVDEGLVLLSRKKAFKAFMVSDALALLLSTSSLFLYFLESMNEDPGEVSKLNAASTVLNIVSVIAMMLTFITGTYVVLSHSPALAITVCVIGSLLFLFIIVLLIKIVCDRKIKRDED